MIGRAGKESFLSKPQRQYGEVPATNPRTAREVVDEWLGNTEPTIRELENVMMQARRVEEEAERRYNEACEAAEAKRLAAKRAMEQDA